MPTNLNLNNYVWIRQSRVVTRGRRLNVQVQVEAPSKDAARKLLADIYPIIPINDWTWICTLEPGEFLGALGEYVRWPTHH